MARQSFSYEDAAVRARASSIMPCNWAWNTSPLDGLSDFAPLSEFSDFVFRAFRTVPSSMASSSAMTRFLFSRVRSDGGFRPRPGLMMLRTHPRMRPRLPL
jgi:hypothetical protein